MGDVVDSPAEEKLAPAPEPGLSPADRLRLKALRAQGGAADGPVRAGFPNLDRHLANLRRWGVPPVVALNRFASDSEAELQAVLDHCRAQGVEAALSEGYLKGGDGMTDLAEETDKVIQANYAGVSPDTVGKVGKDKWWKFW